MLKLVEEKTPNLDYILVRHRGWGKLVSDTKSIQSSLQGMTLSTESRFAESFQLAPQKDYKEGGSDQIKGDLSKLANPHSLVLFASQAKRLGVDVGDIITIQTETSSGRTNTLDVTVVAIGKDLGLLSGFVAILPTSDILELYQLNPGTAGALMVYVKDIDAAESAMNTVSEALKAAGYTLMDYEPKPFFMKFETVMGEEWTGQRLDLSLWNDEVVFLTYALTAFNSITYFLILILGCIIGVGIMNTMWNSVRERTREIGMMRAVGMSRMRVLLMVMLEALVLGLFATSAGAALGAAIAVGVDHSAQRDPSPGGRARRALERRGAAHGAHRGLGDLARGPRRAPAPDHRHSTGRITGAPHATLRAPAAPLPGLLTRVSGRASRA